MDGERMTVEADLRRAIAWLCDPSDAGPEPQAPADATGWVAAFRRNKLPLLTLRTWRPGAMLWSHPALAATLQTEAAAWTAQRGEFAAVAEAFGAEGIRPALIKSAGIAPSFPYRSDNVDTLVPLRQGQAAARALVRLGYVELRNIEEPRKFLFKRFEGSRVASAIHLHEQVGWGTGFLDEERLWDRVAPSFDDRLVLHPGPEDAMLITLAHAFYEDKEVKAWDLVKARHCLAQSGFDWDYAARQAESRGWLPGLDSALREWARVERGVFSAPRIPDGVPGRRTRAHRFEGRYADRLQAGADRLPAPIPFVYSKRHYFAKVAADGELGAGAKADDALRHTLAGIKRKLKVHSQRPMLIALSGVDGSGKTSLAETLQRAFDQCDIRARVVWSRGGSSPLTDALIRLGKRGKPQPADAPAAGGDADARLARRVEMWRRPAVRRLWPWALALDLWLQYMGRIAWPLLRGWVVIADRYVADAVAEVQAYWALAGETTGTEHDGETGRPRRAAPTETGAFRVLAWMSPQPTMAVLVDVSAEVAGARKGADESPRFLNAQVDAYRALAAAGRLVALDNTRDPAVVGTELVPRVLRRYYRSNRTLINALFLSNPRVRRPDAGEGR